jgi:5-methylcytosine-specific restriction enzyme subunit McrC
LKSQGRVGNIPITPEFHIAIRPKVPINNIFGMLDYAYNLKIKFPQGQIQCQFLEQIYETLANILAQKILERCRKGLYRDYLPKTERLAYIRGRVDLRSALQKP